MDLKSVKSNVRMKFKMCANFKNRLKKCTSGERLVKTQGLCTTF